MTDISESATVTESPLDDSQATRFRVENDEYVVLSFASVEIAAPAILTAAEQFVFHSILAGHSSREIAARRNRSLRTVANQVAAVFHKLKLGSRSELIAKYSSCLSTRT